MMRVLVYGIGVIGSLTVHELCHAGNEVTVVARGRWRDVLSHQGLRIKTCFGRKEWTDHPKVLDQYDGKTYDVVFSIMQNQQQYRLLDTLGVVEAKYLVLVGNNLHSREMQQMLTAQGWDPDRILFGFQTSAGVRHKDYTEVVTFGSPGLTLGHLNKDLSREEKDFFRRLFDGSKMKLTFMDDMGSWYRCHAAYILPAAYLCYCHHCNLRACTYRDAKAYIRAGTEAYDFLKSIGTRIRPVNDDRNLYGVRGVLLTMGMWLAAKTKPGELAVSNHCRNAVTEMQSLDEEFNRLRNRNPSFPMPAFDRLRGAMPDWKRLHEEYDKTKDEK